MNGPEGLVRFTWQDDGIHDGTQRESLHFADGRRIDIAYAEILSKRAYDPIAFRRAHFDKALRAAGFNTGTVKLVVFP